MGMPASASSLPLVSIGVPTYNRAAGLKTAVESALAQDYQNLEVVISDNASTDSTARRRRNALPGGLARALFPAP